MITWPFIVAPLVGAAGIAAMAIGARVALPKPHRGDPAKGTAIYVGGIRWFGPEWGLRSIHFGLREAGFEGEYVHWPWHSALAGVAGLPPLRASEVHEQAAAGIADFIAHRRAQLPDAPIYVLGCSAGGWIALRAIELLPEGMSVDALSLLSPAVDPQRDLGPAAKHVAGPLVVAFSRWDWIVLGLGTTLFGTADRRHSKALGMTGLDRAHLPVPANVVALQWRPRMLLDMRLGGHASANAPRFIARWIAPAMGIAHASSR